jgi:glutamate N-acetyltransferase/amino-acid N-acetyltransferase
MNLERSPLAPEKFPEMPDIDGVSMWTAETGAKYKNRPDVLLVKLDKNARMAGVFTKSTAPGAPVDWSKTCLENHQQTAFFDTSAGLLVNAGNANVFTGRLGRQGVEDMAALGARLIGCDPENVFVASTGVIGEPLGIGPIVDALEGQGFLTNLASWEKAAQAISTTDTYSKGASASAEIDGVMVKICGIAKGSGMIAPDMATMLSFIFTDAHISQEILQSLLSEICETSFNAITVDSDTSTSDTVLLAATATAGHNEITDINDFELAKFKEALADVMLDLSHQVVKDGEGASKFIEINVSGADSPSAAKAIGMSIANSPLVKTAIAGEDANWGRVVMAVGKSGEKADRDALRIAFGPHIVAENGLRAENYDESQVTTYMHQKSLIISVDVGIGAGEFTVWTCDLTHSYIDINADYRS